MSNVKGKALSIFIVRKSAGISVLANRMRTNKMTKLLNKFQQKEIMYVDVYVCMATSNYIKNMCRIRDDDDDGKHARTQANTFIRGRVLLWIERCLKLLPYMYVVVVHTKCRW